MGSAVYATVALWRSPNGIISMGFDGKRIAIRDNWSKRTGHPALYQLLNKLIQETPKECDPREIQVQFLTGDGTVTKGPKLRLPKSARVRARLLPQPTSTIDLSRARAFHDKMFKV